MKHKIYGARTGAPFKKSDAQKKKGCKQKTRSP